MYNDEIIAEVWRNRDAYTARHHNSLNEMVSDLKYRQEQQPCLLADRRGKTQSRLLNPSANGTLTVFDGI